jgi:hypothetical protein
MKNKTKQILKNVTIKVFLVAGVLKVISEPADLLTLSSASDNTFYIKGRDWADVSPDISEELYDTVLPCPVNYFHSGTGNSSQPQYKYPERDMNALVVNCDESSLAHERRFD